METPAGPVAMDTAAPPGGGRHALLAVIGEIGTEPERGALRGALERGGSVIHLASSLVGFPCMKSKLNGDLLTACPSWNTSFLQEKCLMQGIRSWNINTLYCDLNHQLRLFVNRHLAQFSSEVKGSYKEDGGFPFTRGSECKLHWKTIEVRSMFLLVQVIQFLHGTWNGLECQLVPYAFSYCTA
ncbi:uncharacterized protein LOC128794915 isoform X1 [Vidua chalybeata]|uniref:uncharacterized protein LOC128794915 isoform X1 n=1 Tax=Vidua chalybeata TaxID=81927 RepID=UPI0023A8BB22|nr:uncharacterized protein LOC128794915 isoform X1 [Vidua chalybeata]